MKTSRARILVSWRSLMAILILGLACVGLRLRWYSPRGGIINPWTSQRASMIRSQEILRITDGVWLPWPHQAAALERRLPAFLRSQPQAPFMNPSNYYLRYAGLVVDGHYLIYADAVSNAHGIGIFAPWKIYDGGPEAAFRVVFDPQTQKFSHFESNGPWQIPAPRHSPQAK